jgi:hypothetical protein
MSFVAGITAITLVMGQPVCAVDARQTVKGYALARGWQGDQLKCLNEIVRLESRWNPKADNPHSTAHGLFQVLGTKKGTGVVAQVIKGLDYIEHRYSTPCSALVFHSRHGYY